MAALVLIAIIVFLCKPETGGHLRVQGILDDGKKSAHVLYIYTYSLGIPPLLGVDFVR
jgi:hypothetical protein